MTDADNLAILRDLYANTIGLRGQRRRAERRALKWAIDGLAAMALIETLRADEADSVTIFADNADFGGPNSAVECCGGWTGWLDQRFVGDNLLEALVAASIAKARTTLSTGEQDG